MSVFESLYKINVNEYTEKKNDLTYLSWANAWAEVKKAYPDATYTIEKFNGLPFVYDENTGYMVYTTVTIEGLTHEMWLPVMDSANKAMKAEQYKYKVKNPSFKWSKLDSATGKYIDKYGNEQPEYLIKTCEAATMFDVNKTIMRCLTKNLAMFGLGLYIYAGEDLPEDLSEPKAEEPTAQPTPAELACVKCGTPFKDTKYQGKVVTAEQQYASAIQKRGGAYCKKCFDSMKKAQNEG